MKNIIEIVGNLPGLATIHRRPLESRPGTAKRYLQSQQLQLFINRKLTG